MLTGNVCFRFCRLCCRFVCEITTEQAVYSNRDGSGMWDLLQFSPVYPTFVENPVGSEAEFSAARSTASPALQDEGPGLAIPTSDLLGKGHIDEHSAVYGSLTAPR